MEFHFTKEDAMKYGIEEAIILYNLKYWLIKNKANGKNFIKGKYWTYNSCSAFAKIFPFWNEQKIGRLLREMETKGIIISSNFNKNKMDKSKWYSVVDESFMDYIEESLSSSDCSEMNNDCSKMNNGTFKNEQCIDTYNKPYIKNTNNKTLLPTAKKEEPSVKEITNVIFDLFNALYVKHTGNSYLPKKHEFVLLTNIVKKFDKETIINKVYLFEAMCKNKVNYFTKRGFADFTIGKLVSQWNEIVVDKEEPQEDKNLFEEEVLV